MSIISSNHLQQYEIEKVVQGSFCQSNLAFGSSAGLQCSTNSLVSICWSQIKNHRYWVAEDLDDILTCGDSIYKTVALQIGNHRLLGIDDLPNVVCVFNHQFTIHYLGIKTGEVRDRVFLVSFFKLNKTVIISICCYAGCLPFTAN